MKKPAALCLLALTLGVNISCEQQSYEETKMFNQSSKATPHGHNGGTGEGTPHAKQAPASEHKTTPEQK